MSSDRDNAPVSRGIVIKNGGQLKMRNVHARNFDVGIDIDNVQQADLDNVTSKNSPEWEERRRKLKLGLLGGLMVSVGGGGILHFLGWA